MFAHAHVFNVRRLLMKCVLPGEGTFKFVVEIEDTCALPVAGAHSDITRLHPLEQAYLSSMTNRHLETLVLRKVLIAITGKRFCSGASKELGKSKSAPSA